MLFSWRRRFEDFALTKKKKKNKKKKKTNQQQQLEGFEDFVMLTKTTKNQPQKKNKQKKTAAVVEERFEFIANYTQRRSRIDNGENQKLYVAIPKTTKMQYRTSQRKRRSTVRQSKSSRKRSRVVFLKDVGQY